MSDRIHEIKHAKGWRPLIMGRNGMVAAGHPLAALAGVRVLEEGGNAVDAALAAAFTMAVVRPEACGFGCDLFSLVYMKGEVEALNASGPAPAQATIAWFLEKGLSAIPTSGPLSIAIPGGVDGWMKLHEKYASKNLARLARDAVGYARDGFPLSRILAERIKELAPGNPSIDRSFRNALEDLRPGRVLVQKQLAHTIERIVKQGRAGFYEGEIGEKICAGIQAEGGLITQEDLQGNFAEWLRPISSIYRGYRVYEQPPVSQGFIVLEMLNLMEHFPLVKMPRADVIHVMTEAKKVAFEDRMNHLEDPRFGDPEVDLLISKEHARKQSRLIAERPQPRADLAGISARDTDYLCAVDRDGNAVSIIQSVFFSFGSRVVPNDTGVVMNNRLCSFHLDTQRPNALKPGKRPAHTLNSYMVFQGQEFLAAGGTPGGDDQPQTNSQILHNLLDLRMDPQTAVESPRWSHRPGTRPSLQEPEELQMETGFSTDVIDALKAKGHCVTVVRRWSFGSSQVIIRDPITGSWMGGADPRKQGYAIGW